MDRYRNGRLEKVKARPILWYIFQYLAHMRKPRNAGISTFSGVSPCVRVGGVEPLGTCCNQAVFVETPTILGHYKSMIFNGFRCKMLDFRWIMKFVGPRSGPGYDESASNVTMRGVNRGASSHPIQRRNHSATGSIIRPDEGGPLPVEFRDMGESPARGRSRWLDVPLGNRAKSRFQGR